jgi:DNA mismatch repair protein MSH2
MRRICKRFQKSVASLEDVVRVYQVVLKVSPVHVSVRQVTTHIGSYSFQASLKHWKIYNVKEVIMETSLKRFTSSRFAWVLIDQMQSTD